MKRPRTTVKPLPGQAAAELRRLAETKLHTQRPVSPVPFNADTARLLHELQVHQVELEMQNAELLESRDRTEALLEKYTDLYDFAPAGYFTLSDEGTIQQVNLTGAGLLGSERSHLVGQSFALRVITEQRAKFHAFLQQVFAEEAKQEADFELKSRGQPLRIVKLRAQRCANGQECNAVAVDITERTQLQSALQHSEALSSTLITAAPVGIYIIDAKFRLQHLNSVAMDIFQHMQPLIGRDFAEIVHLLWPRRVADRTVAHFRHTLKTGEPYKTLEFTERRLDLGVEEAYEWQIQRVTLPDGERVVVCFFNNITERRRAEWVQRRLVALTATNKKLETEIEQRQAAEKLLHKSEKHQAQLLKQSQHLQTQLRGLSHQILNAQETERKRISRELHDVIAQTLVGINVHLATLSLDATSSTSLKQKVARTQRLVEQATNTVHEFARELRPAVLDDLGLVPALESFIICFTERTGVRVALHVFKGLEAAIGTHRTVLYRIAQEALTNVSRHAKANRAEVNFKHRKGIVCMEITDNGQGFAADDSAQTNKKNRLGLLGMRERVEMIGGTFCVKSTPGQPTTVRVEISAEGPAPHKRMPNKTRKPTSLECP